MTGAPSTRKPLGFAFTARADSELAVLQVDDVITFPSVRFLSTSRAEVSEIVDPSHFDGVVLSSKTMHGVPGVAVTSPGS